MKAKNWLLFTGLAISGLVWNGCYTQLARPDQEDETQVVRESEPSDDESEGQYTRGESDERRDDDRHATHVYVYGGGWYNPYWYYPAWSWYRYPRSRFYVSVGFGYYDPFDPWGWCGTGWGGYDPWDYYYAGYWDPYYYGWRNYDHFYSPRVVYRDRVVEQKKRTITRRGSSPGDDNSPGTYAGGSGRGSLARPASGTFARGDDGSYRRIRRTDGGTLDRRGDPNTSVDPNTGSRDGSGRRTVRRSTNDGGDNTIYRQPTNDGNSSGDSRGSDRRGRRDDGGSVSRHGSSGSSGSGGSVSRPSGSSGRSSPPPSSGGSSGGGSSNRRTRH